ncbi:NUDIX hydrolase [Actinosynnema sp. CA-299493]
MVTRSCCTSGSSVRRVRIRCRVAVWCGAHRVILRYRHIGDSPVKGVPLSSDPKVTTGALVVVPGPGGTITFVRQERGPYAGCWLLPGGKVEFGESLLDAARREAAEESGCVVGDLTGVGLYEMRGAWSDGRYHFVMYVFRAEAAVAVPTGFSGHHVSDVRQARWTDLAPHPTDMQILNDAGVADYPQSRIDAELARDGITMTCHRSVSGRAEVGALIGR